VSRRDLVLTVCEKGQDRPQLYTVDVTHTEYMPLHYMLLCTICFCSCTATLASTIVFNYRILTGLVSKHSLSSKSFISTIFTSVLFSYCSFMRAGFFNNILLMYMLLVRQQR
jgi:hypothetical protein